MKATGKTEPRHLRLRPTSVVVVSGVAALAACGGDNLLLPQDGEPARISVVSGDNQTGTVGRPLGDSLVVLVTDAGDRPVSGVEVVFVPPPGADVTPNDTLLTGTNGQAAVHFTLSTTAGEQMVEARAIPIVPASSSTTSFRVSAQAESAEALVAAGGDGQSGQVSTVLAESLVVRAVDRFGNGVAGIEVTWEAGGGGQLSPLSITTGSDGRAATELTLGDRPGTYSATAKTEALEGSPVSFTATAIAAPRPELILVTEPSSAAAAGVRLQQQPVLQLQDPLGAPLSQADVSVTVQIATGGGSLGGRTTVTSDENGRVSFTDLELRGETGSRTLIFAAEGFTPTTSAEIMVRPGPPAADQSSVSVPNGTAGATTTIRLHLEDEFGNAISGASDLVSVVIDGANQVSGLPVTDLGDGSYSAAYVPVHTGTDIVRVQFNGVALAGSPFQSTIVAGPADPAHTTAEVTRTAGLFTRITAVVTARDAQDNLVSRGGDRVQVQVNSLDPMDAADNGDGTYSFSLVVFGIDFSVAITLNGVAIQGSPFTPTVQ